MERRNFLLQSVSGAAAGALALSGGPLLAAEPKARRALLPVVEQVKRAMLAMQRASWEQGVASQALLELGEAELVVLMAKDAVVRQDGEGRLGMLYTGDAVTDPGSNGEAVLWSGRRTGDPAFQRAADRMLAYFLHKAPRTAEGTLHHINTAPQVWADSMYMAPPFLAVMGHPVEALKQVEGVRRLLWDPGKGLFSHMWDDGKGEFRRRAFWGVGSGWCAAGMTRVLRALPPEMGEERAKLAAYVKAVLDGCLAHQRPDALFHDVVDDPSTFVETNLAQMLTYSIFRGLRGGWLPPSYRAQADRMRKAVHAKVDRLGLVQGVCGSPDFGHAGTAVEGQAFFLLMEAARRDL